MIYLLYLSYTAIVRFLELRSAARNTRWVRANGGVEYGRWQYPCIVAGHVAFYAVMTAEIFYFHPPVQWIWAWPFLAAQVLRHWAIHSLGYFWNTRVWIVPGMARVTTGPYHFISHPIYWAVVIEFITPPLWFGATHWTPWLWIPNAILLMLRIRTENRALLAAALGERFMPLQRPHNWET